MKNYIASNLDLINFYKGCYKNKIDVDKIIKIIEEEREFEFSLPDFQRFRIFLDSCFILWNKEKFEKEYFKNKFIYQEYFDSIKTNTVFQNIFNHINQNIFENYFDSCEGFYLLDDKRQIKGYHQLAKVRNGLAHMQYGNFTHQENGLLLCFGLLNKDKGVTKSNGVVIEPIFHDFVKKFFSNYTNVGVPFKHTWFHPMSDEIVYFYEVKYKDTEKYNGEKEHKMNELTKYQKNIHSIEEFLKINKDIFDVKKTLLSNRIEKKKYR